MTITNYIHGFISDYTQDERSILLYLCLEELQGIASQQSLSFLCKNDNNEKINNFFEGFPIFTNEGKIDLNWLMGSPVYVKLTCTADSVEIVDIKYDYTYYAADLVECKELLKK